MTAIVVAAAIIERDGRFLVTRRQPGVHLEGRWEFPGGKCHARETLADCLARELVEELNVRAEIGPELLATAHDYPDRRVEVHFFRCEISGEAAPQQGQDMRWVSRNELGELEFPAADQDVIELLRNP